MWTDEWQWTNDLVKRMKKKMTKKQTSHDTHNKMVPIDLCEKCVFDMTGFNMTAAISASFYSTTPQTFFFYFWMNLLLFSLLRWPICFHLPLLFSRCCTRSLFLAHVHVFHRCRYYTRSISGYYFRCFMSDADKRFNYPFYVNKLNSFTDFGFGVPPFHMPHYRINVYLLGIFGSIIVHFLHRTFVAFSFFSFIIMCLYMFSLSLSRSSSYYVILIDPCTIIKTANAQSLYMRIMPPNQKGQCLNKC